MGHVYGRLPGSRRYCWTLPTSGSGLLDLGYIDPYTFYVPQITIAAKREPVEIDQFGRVETLLILQGEAGTHPTSTDHVSGPIQTASNGETVGKNQVNSLYM